MWNSLNLQHYCLGWVLFPHLSIETATLERLASKNPPVCPSIKFPSRWRGHGPFDNSTKRIQAPGRRSPEPRALARLPPNLPPGLVCQLQPFHSFRFFGSKTQKHKSRPSDNPRNPAVTLPSRHAAGGTPGRPAHAGQASQRRRAQRWSRRFGGLPVRGTAPHCATPRSAGQLLASPTTPNSRRRPHPTVRTRWAGHVWSLSCIGPARGGPAVVCVLRSGTAVQTRVLRSLRAR